MARARDHRGEACSAHPRETEAPTRNRAENGENRPGFQHSRLQRHRRRWLRPAAPALRDCDTQIYLADKQGDIGICTTNIVILGKLHFARTLCRNVLSVSRVRVTE